MQITMVKKIKADGSPCRKCTEVELRLQESGLAHRINRTVIADERDPASEGMQLAEQYQVDRAPFFIIMTEGKPAVVYTVFLKFLKEVLETETTEQDEVNAIMDKNPDMDFI
jgi:hypothetical protein